MKLKKNFEEFEFYLPNEAHLGASVLIPARYIGESPTPSFYIYIDGVIEQKY